MPKSTKKLKSDLDFSNYLPVSVGEQKKPKNSVPCVLPDGRRLNLEILFSRDKPIKAQPKPKKEKV